MALNATIYRFGIDLSDMNRSIYESLSVHVALHPSEMMERMCARLLAYAWCYEEGLEFTKGLSSENEPDLWKHNYSGVLEHWIELGKPDPKRLKKALGRSDSVTVFTYGGQDVEQWLEGIQKDAAVRNKITIYRLEAEAIGSFATRVQRTMRIGFMIQDDHVHLSFDGEMLEFKIELVMESV